jgi:hypothetical protein
MLHLATWVVLYAVLLSLALPIAPWVIIMSPPALMDLDTTKPLMVTSSESSCSFFSYITVYQSGAIILNITGANV